MIKLLLTGILVYLVYTLFLRYNNSNKINKSSNNNPATKKYSKMNIRDAEFKDIDDQE